MAKNKEQWLRNTTKILRRVRNEPSDALDTEQGFSVGDHVEFDFHGGLQRGYIVRFHRDSYLFYDGETCRPYADIVPIWEKRELQGYGHAVVLSELRHCGVAT